VQPPLGSTPWCLPATTARGHSLPRRSSRPPDRRGAEGHDGRPSGWAAAYNTNGADHAHKFAALTDRLQACAERLRRVHLQRRPAVEVVAKYAKPAAAAAIYCDPPYLAAVRSAATKRAGLDYAVEFASEAEHRALAEVLHATPAAVLLSGYPSRLYAELYGGWWRLERIVQRPTSNTSGGRGTVATEVVWSNRPLTHQARLLDQVGVLLP
jgi:DNA adenine methylase